MTSTQSDRSFLKCDREDEWKARGTDQQRGLPPPPPEKPCPPDAMLIDLTAPEDLSLGEMPLAEAIRRRRSHRRYTEAPLTLDELSFLLWAAQGVSKTVHESAALLRTVPSAGARHPFETYLSVHRVAGLVPGLYRYLPLAHKLVLERQEAGLGEQVDEACYGQHVKESSITFIWTAVPDRTEWRYSFLAPKLIAMDAGHLCQNLYLACEAIGAGMCAIGTYNQHKLDAVLGVDGQDEFAVYAASVGRIE